MIQLIIRVLVFFHFSVTVYISGHLRNDPGNKAIITTGNRQVIVKGNSKVIARTKTDKKGDFSVSFTDDPNIRSYSFYFINSGDTIFLKSVSSFESETPELTLYI